MTTTSFAEISAPTPDLDDLALRQRTLLDALAGTDDVDAAAALLDSWDATRRQVDSWSNLVDLRFNRDTTDATAKADLEARDQLLPTWTELDVAVKRAFLEHPCRAGLAAQVGEQAFALWEVDVLSFDPALKQSLVQESTLEAAYNGLLAGARVPFRGETLSLSTITPWRQHKDRATRHEAEAALWGWFAEQGATLDQQFDELVRLRTGMARSLGHADFVELGYKRMARIDYDRDDVERFRAQVREHVVPLATELAARQATTLGVDKLMAWDEAVLDPAGNPVPQGDHDWMLARAREMFDAMGHGLGDFFRRLDEGGFLDLKSRDGKAGGGFCTNFPTHDMPFVFANFNGTKGDVEVFTHEVGHAFQSYSSSDSRLMDTIWPTYESCEIHSMSLEFLTWPEMERFFGDDAERFRQMHLAESLSFLPYGTAVDHFQHEVYSRPDASPAERHAIWKQMEATYLPWRDWGDLAYPAMGGRWQLQRHIYMSPFYYIDYVLAQTCALQFLGRARRDPQEALTAYVALCQRGGEAPFQDLARSAGLVSPFDDGCLASVVGEARAALGL